MKRLLLLALISILPVVVAYGQQTTFTPVCAGADDTAKFTEIIAAIGANSGTIRLPYKAGTRCAVSSLSIPSNIALDNSDGTGIKVNSGQVLVVAGPRICPVGKTMFFGTGTVTLTGRGYDSLADATHAGMVTTTTSNPVVVSTDDSRNSDTRVPTDASVTDPKITGGGLSPSKITGTAVIASDSRLSDSRTPTDGSVTPAKLNASAIDPSAGVAGARTLGSGSQQATAGNDSRLSDTRTPTDNTVSTTKIVDGAVTVGKLAPSGVSAAAYVRPNITIGVDGRITLAAGVAKILDANASPYNCVPDTGADQTACIQSVINAATTSAIAGSGTAVIELEGGVYTLTGALTHSNSLAGTNIYNAQITIPKVLYTQQRVVLVIRNKQQAPNPMPFFTAPSSGVTFKSTLTGQSYSGTWGWPSVIGGPDPIHGTAFTDATQMTLFFDGVAVREPLNPSLCGVNAQMINSMYFKDYRADTAEVFVPGGVPTSPTNPTGVASLMPIEGIVDSAGYYGRTFVVGYYAGAGISEVTFGQELQCIMCRVAVNVQAPFFHNAHINNVVAIRGPHGIGYVNPTTGLTLVPVGTSTIPTTPILIDNFDIEEVTAGDWRDFVDDIYDPSSHLAGIVRYNRVVTNLGALYGLGAVVGARNLKLIDILRPHANFDLIYDAGGVSGQLLTARYPYPNQGAKWTAIGAVSGFKYVDGGGIQGSTAAADNQIQTEANSADGYWSINQKFASASGGAGLIFRYSDSTHYWFADWVSTTGVITVYKVNAGPAAAQGNVTIAPSLGVFYTHEVILSGTSIIYKLNGTQVVSLTDSFNQTATKHGFQAFDTAALFNSPRFSSYNY